MEVVSPRLRSPRQLVSLGPASVSAPVFRLVALGDTAERNCPNVTRPNFLNSEEPRLGSAIPNEIHRILQIRDSSNFGELDQVGYFFKSPLFAFF